MTEVQKQLGNSRENLVAAFGNDAVKSNYAFHAALLNSTAEGLRPWSDEKTAVNSSTILMFKAISTVGEILEYSCGSKRVEGVPDGRPRLKIPQASL